MNIKEQLIHDICVLQERINFYNESRHAMMIDQIINLEKRQSSAIDQYVKEQVSKMVEQ